MDVEGNTKKFAFVPESLIQCMSINVTMNNDL